MEQTIKCPAGAKRLSRHEMKGVVGGSQWYVVCTLYNFLGCYMDDAACAANCPQPSNCRWNYGCPNDLPPGDWWW
jgi:hypothetical protein